jgi:putative DNA methylase
MNQQESIHPMTTNPAPAKLIEVALPLDVINREAAREKSIRHGHPSTLHLWWARRPLAACRAVLFAQLVDDPSAHPDRFPTLEAQGVERERLFDIIRRLVPWEASNDEGVLNEARREIERCYPGGPPPILDPFAGGGSIPLEAARLSLESHASDLNPVAVLINRALIEFAPRVADRPPVHPDDGTELAGVRAWRGVDGLAEDVRWYGNWIGAEAEKRIGTVYPQAKLPSGETAPVIAWLWARTVRCPNPACGSQAPLIKSFWLGKKRGKEAWVSAIAVPSEKRVRFEVSHDPAGPPDDGTVSRSGARCLVCSSPIPLAHVRAEGQGGRMHTQLMAVVAQGDRRRIYLPPSAVHEDAAKVAPPDDVPDEPLATHPQYMGVPRYGMTKFSDLFTPRQLLAISTFSDLVSEAHGQVMKHSKGDREYADIVATYLAFCVSRATDRNSSLCGWDSSTKVEGVRNVFARQALSMVWDFGEGNVFGSGGGNWADIVSYVASVIDRLPARVPGLVEQANATERSYVGFAISTDPPYYDNVPYSDLADFFYVWLRRSLRDIYPDLLATVLTPKLEELVADSERFGGREGANSHFESGFGAVFARACDAARPDTPMTIFYAFRQSESSSDDDGRGLTASTGWEKMLQGLVSSGLVVCGTWPMRTEMVNRTRTLGSNALASSIVLACRPRSAEASLTDRRGFLRSLHSRLSGDLRVLQSGGVAPVDLAQAAIGPGMAVFSTFAKVVEPSGEPMTVRTALTLINQVLDEVSAEHEGVFDEGTRWAIAWYSEYGHDDGPYGRADDLARAKNVRVDGLVRAGIVKSGAGKVRLLDRDELDPSWNPSTDSRVTVWEVCQHLIRRLDEGAQSAGEMLARVGGLGDAARDLAYRLFQIAESKKWAKEAGPYNALAAEWPELTRIASIGPAGQGTLL